jgi:uncharacterized membrane protein YeaQ/YmgE (transglycosylase-associated protein family)
MSIIATAVVGVLGSLLGGFLGGLISRPKEGAQFHPAGLLLSIVGALILLVIWRFV